MMQVEDVRSKYPGISYSAFVHSMAFVDNTVIIGAQTRVWQFASIIRGAEIGDNCNIANGATIDGSRIGNRCIIGHNVAMGPGFWLGDDVFLGPQITLCNDLWPRTHKIGFRPEEFTKDKHAIMIHKGASIGANSVLLPGIKIGEGAMIAAGSIVDRDVPAGHLWKNGRSSETHERVDRMRFAT